jgi:DNA-directed RNA polymerase specialized sigma24 family protein
MAETFEEGSITRCLDLLKRGERDAAQLLWRRYIHRVTALARARLRGTPRGTADEEDVALGVFDSVFRGAEAGRFPRLEDRDDLWQVLVVVTVRKAANLAQHERRAKRGGGKVMPLSELEGRGVDGLLDNEPGPELAAQLAEECGRLLGRLGDESLRLVARRKLEGYTNVEIAGELGCVESTVERKLQRIRGLWARDAEG